LEVLSAPKFSYPNICNPLDPSRPFSSEETIILYRGVVTQQKTKSILAAAEDYLRGMAEDPQIIRKIFYVMVESLQNMAHHSEEPVSGSPGGYGDVFWLKRDPLCYTIASGNLVASSKAGLLMEKLELINSLNGNGLKKKYLYTIQAKRLSKKAGAGVGLVDMARRSEEKLKYNFYALSGKYSFFSLNVSVSRKLSS
jgi:hypothetical protein